MDENTVPPVRHRALRRRKRRGLAERILTEPGLQAPLSELRIPMTVDEVEGL